MRTIYKIMLAVALLLSAAGEAKAQTMPSTDGTYYYIKFKNGGNVIADKGVGVIMATEVIAPGAQKQLWKVEEVTPGSGTYIITSQLGNKLAWNGTDRYITNATAGEPMAFDVSTNGTYAPAWELRRASVLATAKHINSAGGNGVGAQIAEWNVGDQGNPLVFISDKDALLVKITSSTTTATGAVIGGDPGKFSQAAKTQLLADIATAQGVYDAAGKTSADYAAANNALITAGATFLSSVIMPEVSTTVDKWYFFQGQRPANTYLTNSVAGGAIIPAAVIPDDTQLWKFVVNGAGVAMVNKATGAYLDADHPVDNNGLLSKITVPTLALHFIASDIFSSGIARFWIENTGTTFASATGVTFRLHAGNSNVINYTGNRYDNSSWMIMDYGIALKGFLNAGITSSQAALASTILGTQTSVNTLTDAVAAAQAVYANDAATASEVTTATAAINTALTTYNANIYLNLVSTSSTPKWFIVANHHYPTYVMTTNGNVADNGLILHTEVLNTLNDSELWRYELNADNTTVKIISYSPNGYLKFTTNKTELVSLANANDFVIGRTDLGINFVIKGGGANDHLYDGNHNIVAWNLSEDQSSWTLTPGTPTITGLNAATDSKVVVYCNANHQIVVSYSEKIGNNTKVIVYNTTGQVVATQQITSMTTIIDKSFAKGIYLVSVNGKASKVVLN